MSDKGSPEPKFRPARRNANRHSQRGLGMLTRAMQRGGYVAPMTATADGEIIDGSARLEVSEDVFDGVEPLVVDHDGTRPVIMRRTDIPNADDPRAVAIALEANRIAEADLVWDPEVLAEIAAEGEVDLSQLWSTTELAEVMGALDGLGVDDGGVGEREDDPSRGDVLALVNASLGDPRHVVVNGEVWRVGRHHLVVVDILSGWGDYLGLLEPGDLFAPIPSVLLPHSTLAAKHRLVMVQPDPFLAGHLLDRAEEIMGAGAVSRQDP